MKQVLLLLIFSLIPSLVGAQEVISTGGDQFTNSNYQLSWTLGEAISESYIHPDYVLTQGFHQSNATIDPMPVSGLVGMEIALYPNPANEYVCVVIQNNAGESSSYELWNLSGQLFEKARIDADFSLIEIDHYLPGLYLLKVIQDGQSVETFKLIITK